MACREKLGPGEPLERWGCIEGSTLLFTFISEHHLQRSRVCGWTARIKKHAFGCLILMLPKLGLVNKWLTGEPQNREILSSVDLVCSPNFPYHEYAVHVSTYVCRPCWETFAPQWKQLITFGAECHALVQSSLILRKFKPSCLSCSKVKPTCSKVTPTCLEIDTYHKV